MKNPERLINNALFRTLVRVGGMRLSRGAIRRGVLPLVLPPRQLDRHAERVGGYFRSYFPEWSAAERQRRVAAFRYHYGCKFAEDCISLNVGDIRRFLAIIRRFVAVERLDHFHQALAGPGGTLAVGSHVGTPTFGTAALLSQFLTVPPARYPVVRLCAEPEVQRYPELLRSLEIVLSDYGADLQFITTRRATRSIAIEMDEHLSQGGFVTTNLDVLMGGASERDFELFRRVRVRLPALVGAAKAALRAGATVLPWSCVRTPHGYRLLLAAPIGPLPRLGEKVRDDHPEVAALCEQLRAVLEGWIVARPEQWFYWDRFHKRLVDGHPDARGRDGA